MTLGLALGCGPRALTFSGPAVCATVAEHYELA
jgi:hypothetical protein